jgi:hypothetical protein
MKTTDITLTGDEIFNQGIGHDAFWDALYGALVDRGYTPAQFSFSVEVTVVEETDEERYALLNNSPFEEPA